MQARTVNFLGLFSVLCIVFCALLFPAPALTQTQHVASDPAGNPVFVLDIYDQGESPDPDPASDHSTRTLSDKEKQQLTDAASHWAERLSGLGSQLPVFIDIITDNTANASAISPPSDNSAYASSLQQGLLQNNSSEALASIVIGTGIGDIGWVQDTVPSSLPLNGQQSDLFSTMVHEIGHALGLASSAFEGTKFESKDFNLWDKHLYDHRGIQAQPGMNIVIPPNNIVTNDDFDLSSDKLPYFLGEHVAEVLNGTLIEVVASDGTFTGQMVPGIPINAVEQTAELSHMELKNGLMSHQAYSNYATFLELELAALQDIGYTIDRRNFYGASIYGNGLSIENEQGYFLRNANGSAYIAGQYNTATYGTGLHIYGSDNTLTQRADLLSAGLAGTGIRVDGEANTVTIADGTRVHAKGPYGTGLLVAYGKDHTILHQGQIEAMGVQGIGARFDFGSANNGNLIEYRGSYIHTFSGNDDPLLPELEGALVNNFAVSGSLSGSLAAIYISDNALVENVDILRGAQIRGDIISHWDVNNPLLQYAGNRSDLVTTLSFGHATGSDGMATSNADSLFKLRYDGNIIGPNGMEIQLAGGQLAFNGTADVIGVNTAAGSILSGNALYKVGDSFINNGILAPGNSIGTIRIEGDYTQANTGQLRIEFDGAGHTDQLMVTGTSTIAGALALSPSPSFYTGTVNFSQDAFLHLAGTPTVNFDSTTFIAPASPTLSMSMSTTPSASGADFAVSTQRAAHTYSRYARNSTATAVGDSLLALADSAQGDMQYLLASMDFSALDGSTVGRALPQLSPAVYASVAQASINTGHLLTGLLTTRMLNTLHTKPVISTDAKKTAGGIATAASTALPKVDQGWTAFASPYGASNHQSSYGSQLAYSSSDVGLLGGVERTFEHGLVGAHLAFNAGRLDARDDLDAQNTSNAVYVGVHGLYNPQEWGGAYTYALLRGGVENNSMKRSVTIDAYKRTSRMEWTGLNAGAVLGGGYDWQMDNWNFGPTLNLEYGMAHRPDHTETGGEATRLHLKAAATHSLRSAAGVSVGWNTRLDEKVSLHSQLSALWLHELLDDTQETQAAFAGYDKHPLTTKTRMPSRDSMGLQAEISMVVNESTRISAQLGTEFFRPGYSTIQGNIALSWQF